MPAVRERASDVTTRTTHLQNSYLFSVSLIATFPSVQTADAAPGAWRRVSRARSDPYLDADSQTPGRPAGRHPLPVRPHAPPGPGDRQPAARHALFQATPRCSPLLAVSRLSSPSAGPRRCSQAPAAGVHRCPPFRFTARLSALPAPPASAPVPGRGAHGAAFRREPTGRAGRVGPRPDRPGPAVRRGLAPTPSTCPTTISPSKRRAARAPH